MSQDDIFHADETPESGTPRHERQTPTRIIDRSGGTVINLADEAAARAAVAELLEHKRARRGKLIGLAGLPRHGKSEFAKKTRDHFVQNIKDVEHYAKTESEYANIYHLPRTHRRDVLIDLAGEDFKAFGDSSRSMSKVAAMTRLLWPVLAQLDGIILFVSLPLLWSAWNKMGARGERVDPSEVEIAATSTESESLVNSIQTLLKYTIVAKQLRSIRRREKALSLPPTTRASGQSLPEHDVIDNAFTRGKPLSIPVFIAYSKSDLFITPTRSDGLRTAPFKSRGKICQPVITPSTADPLLLGRLVFPALFQFLEKHARYFKFDFVHVVHDPDVDPSPEGARTQAVADLKGVVPAIEFVTEHPWPFQTAGTGALLAWDRKRNRGHWVEAMNTLLGPHAPSPKRPPTARGDTDFMDGAPD